MATTQKALSTSNSESPLRLAARCGLFFAPLAALLGFAAVTLYVAGELMPPRDLVSRQAVSPAIYYPIYQPKSPYPSYKIEAVTQRRPEVLILGDSRGFSIRSEFALAPEKFYNATLIGANEIGTVRAFLEHLPQRQLPRQAILVIDPWWFRQGAKIHPVDDYFDPASRMEVFNFAWRNGIYWGLLHSLFSQPAEYIGVNATLQHAGFRADGSFRAGLRWLALDPNSQSLALKGEMDKVDQWSRSGHAGMSADAVDEIRRLLSFCKTHHVRLIAYLTALHPTLYQAARQDRRLDYFWDLKRVLNPLFQENGARFFEFQDPSVANCGAPEYLDILHESEVCTVRVLRAMAQRDPSVAEIFKVQKFEALLDHRASDWQLGF